MATFSAIAFVFAIFWIVASILCDDGFFGFIMAIIAAVLIGIYILASNEENEEMIPVVDGQLIVKERGQAYQDRIKPFSFEYQGHRYLHLDVSNVHDPDCPKEREESTPVFTPSSGEKPTPSFQ